MSTGATEVRRLTAKEFSERWERGERPRLIDVRTPVEFAEVHATMAEALPLADLSEATAKARGLADLGTEVVLICKSGARATKAATALKGMGIGNVAVVEGGTDAWVAAGLPVARSRQVLPLIRQVHIVFGLLNLSFSILALAVNPLFVIGCLVMSLGILNAGLTGWCGLGLLIARAPWNRQVGASCQA